MANSTYKVDLNTGQQPVYYGFFFARPVAGLVIQARDTATGSLYYLREIPRAVKEVNINFPVTPDKLTISIESPNAFETPVMLKNKINAPKVDWGIDKQTPTVYRNWPLDKLRISYTDLGWKPDGTGGTPARIFVEGPLSGLLEWDRYANSYMPQQWKAAITRHEVGHYFHDDEQKADLWALYRFMEDGYNISQFEMAFVKILRHGEENVKRLIAIYYETRDFEARHYHN